MATESDTDYNPDDHTGLVYKGKVREILREDGKKLSVKGDTVELLMEYFDIGTKKLSQLLIDNMPRRIRGDNIGSLRHVTINQDDVNRAISKLDEIFGSVSDNTDSDESEEESDEDDDVEDFEDED
jgi:hypothetical protein